MRNSCGDFFKLGASFIKRRRRSSTHGLCELEESCLPAGGLIAHSCKNWWCGDGGGGREEKLSCTTHCVSRVLFLWRGCCAAIARWRLQTMTVHLLIRAALITASHTHQSVAAPQIFTFPAARAIANTRRGAACLPACVRACAAPGRRICCFRQ